ncbi:MAG: superoxide dismutase [Bacteroidales bacterium]|nr:superoxide dismutase [Bacteroidales bacterium]MDZ4204811.1 superoxide dismutase [Bacteroidales bacterium]
MELITKSKDLLFTDLPYTYDALEPHIDKMTMEIHHSKHHKAYYDKFMAAIKGTEAEEMSLGQIFASMSKLPVAVRNNGGGFFNHNLYWNTMSPNGGGAPQGDLSEAINNEFGSFEQFKTQFNEAAVNRFGSGWAWLSVKADRKLCACSSPNQDNPLMDLFECPAQPIITLDVWEHAYYLKYQNRRPDYINAFWNVVDWKAANEKYLKALGRL